jgi:hypothetical protein
MTVLWIVASNEIIEASVGRAREAAANITPGGTEILSVSREGGHDEFIGA